MIDENPKVRPPPFKKQKIHLNLNLDHYARYLQRDPHVMKGVIIRDSCSGQLVRIPKLSGPNGMRELRELRRVKTGFEFHQA